MQEYKRIRDLREDHNKTQRNLASSIATATVMPVMARDKLFTAFLLKSLE